MPGRIRRLQRERALATAVGAAGVADDPVCPLCDRPIPPAQADAHHLVPKSRGGRHTAVLHRVCHRQIHALLGEAELARHYASVDALRTHPGLRAFIAWVQGKPPDFFVATRKSGRLRGR